MRQALLACLDICSLPGVSLRAGRPFGQSALRAFKRGPFDVSRSTLSVVDDGLRSHSEKEGVVRLSHRCVFEAHRRTRRTHHSYATVLPERALDQAKAADTEIARGLWRGPLHGVPIAVKDLCYTTFAPTSAGTTIFRSFRSIFQRHRRGPARGCRRGPPRKAADDGGRLHFASSRGAPPLNPWNTSYWVGSSSTGSGVATSLGLCYGSLGSDTGGSIRFPSATCGLTGIKPTWGRVSRYGVFPLADTLDHVGPMTRSVADAAAMLGVIAGADRNDPTTYKARVPDYLEAIGDGIRGLRIGIDRGYATDGVESKSSRR